MYLQKGKGIKTREHFFVGFLKGTDEKSRGLIYNFTDPKHCVKDKKLLRSHKTRKSMVSTTIFAR
jgi:hypothetical protein